jgi:serine/threonine-protein kinase
LRDASTAASLGAPTDGEQTHRWPQISPGGKAVLFTGNISTTNFDNASIEALTLQTGQIKVLYPGGYFGRYFR